MSRGPFVMAGIEVPAGRRMSLEIPLPKLYTHTNTTLPVHIIHGRREGPTLFVCAAIHGDEINGVEVIRRLLKMRLLRGMKGTLIAIPIVNVYGFINMTRYSPDRRDLNRSFPGRESGSLTSQLAHTFTSEIISKCTHGIDFHTGSNHRTNLPQLRVCLDQDQVPELSKAFGAPIILDSDIIEGSLRDYTHRLNIPLIVYEGGEPLRYDEKVIQIGIKGVLNVMRFIGMIPEKKSPSKLHPVIARESTWVRAPQSGILFRGLPVGKYVQEGQIIGMVADPYGEAEMNILSPVTGVIIGRTSLPLLHRGDACFHIATVRKSAQVETAFREADIDFPEMEIEG